MMNPGMYKVRATGEFKYGKTNPNSDGDQKEQVAVVCECVGGDGGDVGRQFTWYGFLNSDDNIRRAFDSLKLLGWDGNAKKVLELEGLGSREAVGDFQVDTYGGKERLKLAWINDPDRAGAALKNPLEGAELQSFALRMQGALAKLENGKPSPGVAKAQPAAKGKGVGF